jgi:hypothetical protein
MYAMPLQPPQGYYASYSGGRRVVSEPQLVGGYVAYGGERGYADEREVRRRPVRTVSGEKEKERDRDRDRR